MKFQLFLVFSLLAFYLLDAQTIPLDEAHWQVINNDNHRPAELRLVEYQGKKAIHLQRHEIAPPKLDTPPSGNFILSFDVAGAVMPGVGFRVEDLWNYEYVYFRIGGSGKKTAIQYIPIYNGSQSWQLYHYPNFEGVAEYEKLAWFKVEIKVYNEAVQVFINGQAQPNFAGQLLKDNFDTGQFLFKTTFADAYYANVQIQPLDQSLTVPNRSTTHSYLTDWKLSEQFEDNLNTQGGLFRWMDSLKNTTWQSVQADRHGLVNLSKFYETPRHTVIAKTTIPSDTDKSINLLFDYSFAAIVILNNQVLFAGKELDTDNFMEVHDGEQQLTLDLKKGTNELVFFITADDLWQREGNPTYLGVMQAMNWGFIARLEE